MAGGYNPKGVLGYGDWRDAISAFLFCWPDGNTEEAGIKLPKCGGSGMAIIDEVGKGPQFGPEGCVRCGDRMRSDPALFAVVLAMGRALRTCAKRQYSQVLRQYQSAHGEEPPWDVLREETRRYAAEQGQRRS